MKLDEINNGGRVPTETCVHSGLSVIGGAAPGLVGAVHGCDPVILDHGAPRSGKLVMLAIGASAPLIRGPSIQGPHHREGRESRDPITVGVRIHGGLDPCRPALVRPGRAASGKPNGPLSSVNPGEDWEGDHGDIPDHRSPEDPIRILSNRILSLRGRATGG